MIVEEVDIVAQLTYPSLIMGLCRRAGVDILDGIHVSITSVVNKAYVFRFCVPRMRDRNQPQPEAMTPPAGPNRYNEQLACRYN